MRLRLGTALLLCTTPALAQPVVQQEAEPSKLDWGVRLLATSTELGANISNARLGTGLGVGVDFQRSPFLNISLELESVDYENSGRTDKRVRIRERFRVVERGRLSGYGILGAGLTFAQVAGPHGTSKGLRVDGEMGMGVSVEFTDRVSLFGELNMGLGAWAEEPRSVLPVELESTSEGYADIRAGVQIRF